MMRTLALLFAACLSAVGCATGRRPPVIYSQGVINIRSAPSLAAPVVRQSAENERMIVESRQGGWYELKAAEQYGDEWVPDGLVSTPQQEMDRRCKEAVLRVEGWTWKKYHDDMFAEGTVTNISGGLLRNVTVRVTYWTAPGVVVSSDVALIEYNPILPGESSPFKVVSLYNAAVARGKLKFAILRGPDLAACHRPR
jgi:hypothetical protein